MDEKIERLISHLKTMDYVLIALSGGVDSSFLAKIAHDTLENRSVAITISSPLHPYWEQKQAEHIASMIGIDHIILILDEKELETVFQNDVNRCYHCKKLIFSKIKTIAKKYEIPYVLDGSNADDSNDFRPGKKALQELGIISPLKDAGLTKQEIRRHSKTYGLETSDFPSFACLASRIPYGQMISKEKLTQIEHCEEVLQNLGIQQFRVRHHQEIARIEVEKGDFQLILDKRDMILKAFKKQGFLYVTLDLEGYRTGSLNEGLNL